MAKAFTTLTGVEATCKNAVNALKAYGFKCSDNLNALFGENLKLEDVCCESCGGAPKTTVKATTSTSATRRTTTTSTTSYTLTTTSTSTSTQTKTSSTKVTTTSDKDSEKSTPKPCKPDISKCNFPDYKGDGNCDDGNKSVFFAFVHRCPRLFLHSSASRCNLCSNCGCEYDNGDCCGPDVKKTYCKEVRGVVA